MDQYEELDLIGKGTYGKVYKVRSRADDAIYVVKKVHFDGAPQSEAEAALREGQMLSLLRHPHVVPYKEFFKHSDGDLCLVMAFCEGGDLFRYIRDLRKYGKTVPEPQVWQWLVQLLLSLSYIHAKRILHRDVKTQNIFLSEGKVLLGDFGLAKQLQRTFEMARTPIGTPYYMAPEIYEEQPYSFKSDVWALGCVMYEMMTGKAAFAADNLSRVVLRVIRGQYDPLPESYSASLRSVVTSMLCRDVKSRPDANQLLTVAPVVPHVQSYLETLTAEGPNGWATWRMKLPFAAMVQMSEALEAAGYATSTAGGGGRLSRPSSARSFLNSSVPIAAAAPSLLVPEPPLAAEPSLAPEPPAQAQALPLSPTAGPTTPDLRPGITGGQVVKLPPLPGAKLPPIRTPYGLATPFMGGIMEPQQQYAELQMLARQVMAIRTSQCGDNAPEIAATATAARTASRTAAQAAVGANGASTSPASQATAEAKTEAVPPVSPTAAAPASPATTAPPAASALSSDDPDVDDGGTAAAVAAAEVVKALDRTLLKTLEIARKAVAGNSHAAAAAAGIGGKGRGAGGGGGGSGGGGVIDEAWLSAGLPQGGFGFGNSNTHKEPTSSEVVLLPPINPRRTSSSNLRYSQCGHHHLAGAAAGGGWRGGGGRGGGGGVRPASPQPAKPATPPQRQRPSSSTSASPSPLPSSSSSPALASVAAAAPAAEPLLTPFPGAPVRTSRYEVVDEGFVTLSNVSLHALVLSNRRVNLERYCAERLGDALMDQVMQAVLIAQKHSRDGGDVTVAEAALRRQLDRLLGSQPEALRQELGPLIEEMALLHC